MAHPQGHICQCLTRIRLLRRASPVCIAGDRCRTGEEFVSDVLSLAGGLLEIGIRRGDVVSIAALNSDWYMEWLLAVTYIGGVVAPLNYRWSFEEARLAMETVNPAMLVVDGSCVAWVAALRKSGGGGGGGGIPGLRFYGFIGESSSSSLFDLGSVLTMDVIRMSSPSSPILDISWAPKEVAMICFTSGTTGRPKGVGISHAALIVQSLAKIAIVGYGENDVYLHTAPLCHIGGISSCIAVLMAGGCHVFIPMFNAHASFKAVEQNHVTSLITVPAMMADLVSFGRKANKKNSGETVNKILNGGGSLAPDLISGATHIFPYAKIISAYGMTEACSSLSFMTLRDPTLLNSWEFLSNNHKNKPDLFLHRKGDICVGTPAPHVELRISGNYNSLGSPLIGNILTRGLHVMAGYWDCETAGTSYVVEDGWLDTGDIGWLDDDGNMWLVGRTKDRIKSGGENIYPEEVEAVLCQHPGVLYAVVVGVPDIRLTEKVVACVAIRKDWKWLHHKLDHHPGTEVLSDAILQNHCQERELSRFKIPKAFILWNKPLPLTTTGKLKREDVKKEAISCMEVLHSNL